MPSIRETIEGKPAESLEVIRTELAERSLYHLARQAWPLLEPGNPFQDNWHIGCICEHLQAVTELEVRDLIINVPPRFAKSILVSVFWFCWAWVKQPDSRWICASYSDDLVTRDTAKSARVIGSDWYTRRWGRNYTLTRAASHRLENDRAGFRLAGTVGGRILGEGGDYIVIDDPIKPQDADSKVVRRAVNDWYSNTISQRGNNPQTVRKVVIMQRLSDADLSGYLLADVGGFQHLCLPMRHEPARHFLPDPEKPDARPPKDPITPTTVQLKNPKARDPRTVEGELLWKNRFPDEAVAKLERELRPRGAAGQLQQRPSPAQGVIFQAGHIRRFVSRTARDRDGKPYKAFALGRPDGTVKLVPVSECRLFQCADTATKDGDDNDYTAIVTAALTPGNELLILHVLRAKVEVTYLMGLFKTIRKGPCLWDAEKKEVLYLGGRWPSELFFQAVEDASSGSGLILAGAAEGNPIRPLSADGDKIQKAAPLAILYESGQVYHPTMATWLAAFEDELLTFPASAHDDQVDAAGHAARTAMTDTILRAGVRGLEDAEKEYGDDEPPEGVYTVGIPAGEVDVDFGLN